jgi:hypothetical protein
VFDDFLRKRADKLGANLVNGLYMGMEKNADDSITIRYNKYSEGEALLAGGARSAALLTHRRCGASPAPPPVARPPLPHTA